jgi:hypothetical protein
MKGPFHMTPKPLLTPSDTAARSLKERLQRLEQDLIRQRKRVNATTTLTAIVGAIALIAVAGYSYYGYREVSIFTEPEKVVDLGQQMMDEGLPKLRRRLEIEIVESAPQWANTLSKQTLEQLPVARKRLEKLTTEYMDEGLANTRSMTDQQFRTFLRDHHEDMEKKFEELAKSPELAEASLADLERDLDKEFQTNMQAEAAELLKKLTQANNAFKRMREGKNLNEEEQLGRRAWMIARRLRAENIDLTNVGLSATEPVNPVVQKNLPGSTGAKPVKKPPTPASPDKDKKPAPPPEKKKDAPPDAGKKKDTAGSADKKKDAPPEADKKKGAPPPPKPENKG